MSTVDFGHDFLYKSGIIYSIIEYDFTITNYNEKTL